MDAEIQGQQKGHLETVLALNPTGVAASEPQDQPGAKKLKASTT